MTKLSCLLIGEETLVIGCGDALLERGHEIAGVVSANDKVRAWARSAKLKRFDSQDAASALAGETVDWLLSIANPAPIPEALMALPGKGAINFQDGPLPERAGPNTPSWAIMAGASRHGITWHLATGARDEGDILHLKDIAIASDETAFTLNAKCYEAGLEGFDAVLDQLESGTLTRTPQESAKRRFHKPTARPDNGGRLDFNRPAADVVRYVRALDFGGYWNPLTSPKIKAGGRLMLVGKAKRVETVGSDEPGTVLGVTETALTVATADGAVKLEGFTDMSGRPVELYTSVLDGAVLSSPDAEQTAQLKATMSAIAAGEDHWRARLQGFRPAAFAVAHRPRGLASWDDRSFSAPRGLETDQTLAALAAWAWHNTGDWGAGLAFASTEITEAAKSTPGYVTPWVPLALAGEDPASMPVAAVAEALAPDIDAARRGGFAPDLIARDPALSAIETPQVGLSTTGPIENTVATLSLSDGKVTLWYDARLVENAALALLADRLELFLENLARNPDRPVRELLVMPAAERKLTVVDWNATRADSFLGPIHKAFEAQADRTPDAIALVFNDQELTYAQLDARANALAHRLIEEGARPGDRIGIYLRRSLELVIAAVAIHKAGGAYVPLDPAYPADRLVHYVTDSQATFVVTDMSLAPSMPASDAVPVMVSGDAGDEADNSARPEVEIPDDALAYVIYTSGSTGIPKGVQVEHRNVSNFFTGMDDYLAPEGTWLAVTSLGFDISVLELFYTITRGYKVVIVSEEARVTLSGGTDYSLSAQLIRHEATVLQCTPSMGRMILADEAARAALGGLKQILLGGEAVTASLTADIRSISDAEIIDMYGPTETTIWSTGHRVQGDETGVVPVGKPMINQSVYVLDAHMQPQPVGLPGELWIGGLGVTRGYWQRDELNADRFRRDPFAAEAEVPGYETPRMYGTGDLVRWRADGVLEFLGRTDHQVKIRGQRLELGEIEARINRAAGVRQAVVVPKGEGAETRLVAYIEEASPDDTPDTAAIRADLVANLPEVMVPSQFMVLDALPLTPNRKVDRKALPEPDAEVRIERSADGPVPGEGLEAQLGAIWAEALGLDDIRADDSFFALGGHSLLAVKVHQRVKTIEGLDGTAITEIFRFPVLRDLAKHLAEKNGLAAPEPVEAAPVELPEFDREAIMARRREMRTSAGRAAA